MILFIQLTTLNDTLGQFKQIQSGHYALDSSSSKPRLILAQIESTWMCNINIRLHWGPFLLFGSNWTSYYEGWRAQLWRNPDGPNHWRKSHWFNLSRRYGPPSHLVSKHANQGRHISKVSELADHCCASEPCRRPDMAHAVYVLSSLVDSWRPAEPVSDDSRGFFDFDITCKSQETTNYFITDSDSRPFVTMEELNHTAP